MSLSFLHSDLNPHVMVVDDDRTMRLLLRRQLEREGCQVTEVENGQACLDLYQKLPSSQQPDLILLDGIMPVMDGFRCCQELRKIASDALPILIVTTLNDKDSVNRAFETGATDYITKPIHWAVLRRRVRRLVFSYWATVELQHQVNRERLLRIITEKIVQSLNLEQIFQTTVTETQTLLNLERVAIAQVLDSQTIQFVAEMKSTHCQGILGTTLRDSCLDSYQKGEIRAGSPLSPGQVLDQYQQLLATNGVKSDLTIPIFTKENLWGLLLAHQCSTRRSWQTSEIELFRQLAIQLGIAVQQVQLYERLEDANAKLERLANIDGLTQVANRRSFDHHLQLEWKRLTRDPAPLSLLLCDVDFFKKYNDNYGHQAGDACLQQIAKAITEAARRVTDLAARYGGEEFAVLLPNTSAEGANQIAQMLCQRVKGLAIPHEHSEVAEVVTLSVGVGTMIPSLKADPQQLVLATDTALYQAKQEGRDRACVALHPFPSE
jgi:two-component system cell cycle response regulator